jgi:hypothetical protein
MNAPSLWLLFGLPVTEAEYDLRLTAAGSPASSDYLARFEDPGVNGEDRLNHHRSQWRDQYAENVARPMRLLADRSRGLGVRVRQGATLADLSEAAAKARVIVLFSHWKDASFSNDDFLPNLDEELAARLAAIDDPLAAWLRAAMTPRRDWMGLWRRPPMSPRQALRRCIEARLPTTTPPGIQAVYALATTTASRRRDLLDGWLAGCIRPGNRLELFDGLHDSRALSAAMAGFTGVLDLTVCTSTYLGDNLGRAARNRFRTVQFLNLQDPVEAASRLGLVLTIAAGDAEAYLSARLAVARAYPGLLEAEFLRREAGRP